MNYQIIHDEQKLRDFIGFLPDLEPGETYYLSLFARKQYAMHAGVKSDLGQLRRFTTDKAAMFDRTNNSSARPAPFVTRGRRSRRNRSCCMSIPIPAASKRRPSRG